MRVARAVAAPDLRKSQSPRREHAPATDRGPACRDIRPADRAIAEMIGLGLGDAVRIEASKGRDRDVNLIGDCERS
jgi:hypothetical protein